MRKAKGLTQAQAAKLAGISRVQWCAIEKGTDPMLSTAEKMKAALQ